jgi:hypothetical protein
MRRYLLAMAVALLIGVGPAAAAGDQLCQELKAFERADFTPDVQPRGRRWVELHWVGAWMDFDNGYGLACASSPDAVSQKLCGYLKAHTSFEFANNLPVRILGCHGQGGRTPRPDWGGWRADIDLWTGHRFNFLEVDLQARQGESGAIRLSAFAAGKDPALVEMTPLSETLPPLLTSGRRETSPP